MMVVTTSPPDDSFGAPIAIVQLVLDPEDSLRAREVAARAARPGVVLCRATPGAPPAQLARDVLRALGKRFDVADSPRGAAQLWPRVTTWLRADEIGALLVLRADGLPAESLAQLIAATRRGTGLTLFVHAETIPQALRQVLTDAEVLVQHTDLEDYLTRLPASLERREQAAPKRLPVLPRDDFLFFLEACADVLHQDILYRVCDVIAAARRATDRWLDTLVPGRGPAPERPSKPRVLAFLEALTSCEDSEEALTRLRGAQIALLFNDLLVDVDAHAFVAAHIAGAGTRLDPTAIALLRTYSSPVHAAAGAVALATRAGAPTLARLTVANVSSDGREIQLSGRTAIVPDDARALVRAQRITREAQEAAPHDAFFTSARDRDQAASPSALRTMLGRIQQQTGVAMPTSQASPGSWWYDPARAIRVHEL